MTNAPPRMTQATQLVLRALLANPTEGMYGIEICAAAGLPSGTIHPILARLERIGWLDSRWEDVDPSAEGRPRRRYYDLNPGGAQQARSALAAVDAKSHRLARLRMAGAGGGES